MSTQEDETETLSGAVAADVKNSSVKEGVHVETDIAYISNRYARAKIHHQGKDRLGVRKRS
jgi:predicted TIM-barrel fold metal-dependent hydrolase